MTRGWRQCATETRRHDAVILTDIPAQIRNDILKYCYRYRIRTYVAPKLTDIMLRGAKNNTLFDTPLLMVKGTGLTPMQRIIKRAMDLVLCGIAMIPAAPVMLIIAAAIKIEDGGPVFYKQKRMTRGGREFEILKFRSMIVDAEKIRRRGAGLGGRPQNHEGGQGHPRRPSGRAASADQHFER